MGPSQWMFLEGFSNTVRLSFRRIVSSFEVPQFTAEHHQKEFLICFLLQQEI